MRKARSFVGVALINLCVILILLELGLRLLPQLIPLRDLAKFQPTIRGKIAEQRHLPRVAAMRTLVRDDGGPPLTVYQPGTLLHHECKDPGAVVDVVMDERGFCNPAGAAPGGHSEIVAIGDSFTYCTGVAPEDTWVNKLGKRMGVTAYNLGRPNNGIHEYLQIFKAYGVSMSPRVVVMNVYEGNDMRDAYRMLESRRSPAKGSEVHLDKEPWLLKYSYVFSLIVAEIGSKPVDAGDEPGEEFRSELKKRYQRQDFRYDLGFPDGTVPFNIENADTDEPLFARALEDGHIGPELWDVWREGLRLFVELGRQHSFTPVVSYTPSAYTVYDRVVTFHDPALLEVMRRFSQTQRKFFRDEASALGFVYLDLTRALQAAAEKGSASLLYRPRNIHLTPEGNAVIADALYVLHSSRGDVR